MGKYVKYIRWLIIFSVLYLLFSWVAGGDGLWVALFSLIGLGGEERLLKSIQDERKKLEAEFDKVRAYGQEKRAGIDQEIWEQRARVDEAGRVHQQIGITINKKKEEEEELLEGQKEEIQQQELTADEAAAKIREELTRGV